MTKKRLEYFTWILVFIIENYSLVRYEDRDVPRNAVIIDTSQAVYYNFKFWRAILRYKHSYNMNYQGKNYDEYPGS